MHRDAPGTEYGFLNDALDERDADAFVHVADRFDDSLRYLTRFNGPDRNYGFVYVDGRAILCAPRLFGEQARREFAGDEVRTLDEQTATDAVGRVVEVLDEYGVDGRVLLPEAVPYAPVVALEARGFEVERTSAVADRRERKSDAEIDCIAAVQAAAQAGLARAESVLAQVRVEGDALVWNGEALTTEHLRREINAVLARRGIQDAGNTVIGAGRTCADLHFTGTDEIRPGETVLIDVSPRGPHGYYGDVTRTFVPGEVGDWERETYDAVRAAHDAALAVLDGGAGTRADEVHAAAVEALAAAGFESGDVEVGFYHSTGHGVGVSLHEPPALSADEELAVGNVVTVEPGVYDPERGGVRLEDLVVVTEGGYANLTDYPREIVPEGGRSVGSDS